jgi:hypothetical protein
MADVKRTTTLGQTRTGQADRKYREEHTEIASQTTIMYIQITISEFKHKYRYAYTIVGLWG